MTGRRRYYQEQRDRDPDGLSAQERRFVDLYVACRDAGEAYFQTYRCKGTSAPNLGTQKLRDPLIAGVVAREVVRVSQEAAKMAILSHHGVLEEFNKAATADPREVVEVVVRSCRYCHGKDHKYHFTQAEQEERRQKWEKSRKKVLSIVPGKTQEFDELGGTGYNPVKNPPHPDCPECFGEGLTEVKVHPSKGLSAKAARLYAGAKRTREGVEVKMHDPMAALDKMGQHYGLWKVDAGDVEKTADDRARELREAMAAMDDATEGEEAVAASATT